MSNDLEKLLSTMHGKLAEDMLARLEGGEATAAEWTAIIRFLKDNGVDAIANPQTPESAFDEIARRAMESINDVKSGSK